MIKIAGAGLAGLLAANMLHRYNPIIFEKQAELPNNHHAVLRFRSSVVGDTLGIPFRKVSMIKGVVPYKTPVADALAYSRKVLGRYKSDRSILHGVVTEERYIAPTDLIQKMASGIDIRYGQPCCFDVSTTPIISTVPMPMLVKTLGYDFREEFGHREGWNIKVKYRNCDAFATLYFPDPDTKFYRASVTGDELIIEGTGEVNDLFSPVNHAIEASNALGLDWDDRVGDVEFYPATYQKIAPVNDEMRKRFIHFATERFEIYSLGRFATWRPHLLLDDLVKDIRLIERWLISGSKYDAAKHYA